MGTKDTRFKPGHSGNPKGRPILPPDVKQAIHISRGLVANVITKYSMSTLDELKEHAKDGSLMAIEHAIIRILIASIQKGDHVRLESLLDRTIGRVKLVVETNIERPVSNVERLEELTQKIAMMHADRPTDPKPVDEPSEG